MIVVKITRENGKIRIVECSGHSGYAESGSDIVCSAVSAITQTALLGLKEVSKKRVLYVVKEGYLYFKCPDAEAEAEGIRQEAILNTMVIGLKDLLSGYKAFIKMEER